ncbi:hypothetical protein [Actinoplanes sp. NBRC 103695]|uniref:hypothetical protein n=1 Tax=Actinoplanes sp. NBRC 103695 TaxID=3032202 RepID=UPI0024A56F37|nr:hypothetical protein [Actinoplanes sp. NBRC 103695]GLY96987.1 hypothetical protein Acsp02_42410 [Actinoplanes sp. NBRC 103695]
MLDLLHVKLADDATRRHVLSARPDAPTVPDRPPRQRGVAMRRATVTALRRLADRISPDAVPVRRPYVPGT